MKLLIWAASMCLQMILVKSEEQCDIYGAMVERPGRQCICDQRGTVRCKPRFGGRLLVCVLDMSKLGSNIHELFDKITEQKRTYREFVIGGEPKVEKEEKIDENFDPPEFTMTSRPSIDGGIGNDDVAFGKEDDAQNEVGGDDSGDAGGGGGGGEDEGGDDGKDEGGEERFRRMKHPAKKPFRKLPRFHQTQTSRNARTRSIIPSRQNKGHKSGTEPRVTKTASRQPGSHKVIAKNTVKGNIDKKKQTMSNKREDTKINKNFTKPNKKSAKPKHNVAASKSARNKMEKVKH